MHFRLPLGLLPEEATRRALVLEPAESYLAIFLPPLLTAAFQQLAETVLDLLVQECAVRLQGYVPIDLPTDWRRVAFTADPGVLEVNLPPCKTWLEYDEWIVRLTEIATSIGMCPFKQIRTEQKGTGGGSHLLFGGITLDDNPFFSRPGWLASILRYWQHHPALSYLFTGPYVGHGSQAPRPDESGNDLLDLELSYRQIEQLPAEDCREQVQELLRHLHTDIGGNTHRSEISFDKFWCRPLGQLGLIEFRAIESTPQPEWISTIALLWRAILAYTLLRPFREPLKDWGNDLHDRFFLPTPLWIDLTDVLSDLAKFGFGLDPTIFRAIWAWRFPTLLQRDGWEIRRGLDGWPLLAEVPSEGGTTSRFVDTSMERLEIACQSEFAEGHLFFFNGRELPLRRLSPQQSIAGIRYRKTALYPSLHPQIPPQLPLGLVLIERESGNVLNAYELQAEDNEFRQITPPDFEPGKPCEPAVPGMITCDLRL